MNRLILLKGYNHNTMKIITFRIVEYSIHIHYVFDIKDQDMKAEKEPAGGRDFVDFVLPILDLP